MRLPAGALTLFAIGLILLSAVVHAVVNILTKRAGSINMLAYVVWSSAFAVPG